MMSLNRSIILCEIKLLVYSKTPLIYVPEVMYLYDLKGKPALSRALRQKLQALSDYRHQYEIGIIPMKLEEALQWLEALYNELLKNQLCLPPPFSESDLAYTIKNKDSSQQTIIVHKRKIKIKNHLTFFARYLPLIGKGVTHVLTLGLTAAALGTLWGWEWSLSAFPLFALSKFATSYVDIVGGPEFRLRVLGLWLDRTLAGDYHHFGKFSYNSLLLHVIVNVLLACSSFLTWYGAWNMIRCLPGVSHLPLGAPSFLAGLFALFRVGSNFGRVYNKVYDLLQHQIKAWISFDTYQEKEKIDLLTLSVNLARKLHDKAPNHTVALTPFKNLKIQQHASTFKSKPETRFTKKLTIMPRVKNREA